MRFDAEPWTSKSIRSGRQYLKVSIALARRYSLYQKRSLEQTVVLVRINMYARAMRNHRAFRILRSASEVFHALSTLSTIFPRYSPPRGRLGPSRRMGSNSALGPGNSQRPLRVDTFGHIIFWPPGGHSIFRHDELDLSSERLASFFDILQQGDFPAPGATCGRPPGADARFKLRNKWTGSFNR